MQDLLISLGSVVAITILDGNIKSQRIGEITGKLHLLTIPMNIRITFLVPGTSDPFMNVFRKLNWTSTTFRQKYVIPVWIHPNHVTSHVDTIILRFVMEILLALENDFVAILQDCIERKITPLPHSTITQVHCFHWKQSCRSLIIWTFIGDQTNQ